MKLKQTVLRMLSMCPMAWNLFIKSLQLAGLMHFCSFILLLVWNGSMFENYNLYKTAISLQESAQAILLISVFLSAFIEDYSIKS